MLKFPTVKKKIYLKHSKKVLLKIAQNKVVGKGDFIGMQFVLKHKDGSAVTISETKPSYRDIWNFYDANTTFQDLKEVMERSCNENTGEYIFFPVKDDKIFLPSATAYDLSPHKLDILCQNIRKIEKEQRMKSKRVIIDDYYPVVLSKNVWNALIRNGYKKNEFIYVPKLVLKNLSEKADQQ